MAKIKAKQIAGMIRKYRGNLAAVGREFGVTRQAVDDYVKRHPKLLAICIEAREVMIDNVESVLYTEAVKGEHWAVQFFLRTQGKRRGYVERSEHGQVNIDLSKLTDEQVDRLARGEDVFSVLADTRTS